MRVQTISWFQIGLPIYAWRLKDDWTTKPVFGANSINYWNSPTLQFSRESSRRLGGRVLRKYVSRLIHFNNKIMHKFRRMVLLRILDLSLDDMYTENCVEVSGQSNCINTASTSSNDWITLHSVTYISVVRATNSMKWKGNFKFYILRTNCNIINEKRIGSN